jgi:hypothetical protein
MTVKRFKNGADGNQCSALINHRRRIESDGLTVYKDFDGFFLRRCAKTNAVSFFIKDKNEYNPRLYNLPGFQELLKYIETTL